MLEEKMEEKMKEEKIKEETEIFTKENCTFTKSGKYNYKLYFDIENKNIYITKLINFSLIKLIYDLNPDIYDNLAFENINENECIVIVLLKHFFEDIGLPQRYCFIHIEKIVEGSKIIFKSYTIKSEKPNIIPEFAELLDIDNLNCVCDVVTPHKIYFSFNINFNSGLIIPLFVEKMLGVIIHKIFKRLKQFIEMLHV